MLAAAAAPSGSAAAVVAVVAVLPVLRQVAVGPAHLAHKLLVLAEVRLHLLLRLLRLLLPQVVVESEGPLHLPGRQSFSAATARSSPRTEQPTYERAPSTRSPPNGRPCPSACLNWMPVRG